MNYNYYRFCERYNVAVTERGLPNGLRRDWTSLQISSPDKVSMELSLVGSRRGLPAAGKRFEGHYKGVPWKACMIEKPDLPPQVYFYSRFFTSFLVTRIVILPAIKHFVLRDGGIPFLGSAFFYQDNLFILFGPPGSGKSRILLSAGLRGATVAGDNELALFAGGEMLPIFPGIELRYQTVRPLPLWKKLSAQEQTKLLGFHLISLMTKRGINFNLMIKPSRLGIKEGFSPKKYKTHFVCLERNASDSKIEMKDIIQKMRDYERNYRFFFRNLFYTEKDVEQAAGMIERDWNHFSFWRMSSDYGVENILHLAQNQGLKKESKVER